jgi:hypothetical protein
VAFLKSMAPDTAAMRIIKAREIYYATKTNPVVRQRAFNGWMNRLKKLTSIVNKEWTPTNISTDAGVIDNATPFGESGSKIPANTQEALQTALVDHYDNDMQNRLALAFPCYLMLLIDGGRWIRQYRIYDKFFGLFGVSEIEIWKSREEPAHVATITMSNMYNKLTSQVAETQRENQFDVRPQRWTYESLVNLMWQAVKPMPTKYFLEMRAMIINSLMLKAGSRVHIRIGYGSDGSKLPVAFNGTIMQVPVTEGVVQVIAVGDGHELKKEMPASEVTTDKYNPNGAYVNTGIAGAGKNPRDIVCDLFVKTSDSIIGEIIYKTSEGTYIHNNLFGIENFGRPSFYNRGPEGLVRGAGIILGTTAGALVGVAGGTVAGVFGGGVPAPYIGTLAGASLGATAGDIIANSLNTAVHPGEIGVNIYNPGKDPINNTSTVMANQTWIWRESDVITGVAVENTDPWSVIEVCRKVAPDFVASVEEFGLRSTLFYGKPWWPLHYDWDFDVLQKEIKNVGAANNDQIMLDPYQAANFMKKKTMQQLRVVTSNYNLLETNIETSTEELYTAAQTIETQDAIGFGGSSRPSTLKYFDCEIFTDNIRVKLVKSGVYTKALTKLGGVFWGGANKVGEFFDGLKQMDPFKDVFGQGGRFFETILTPGMGVVRGIQDQKEMLGIRTNEFKDADMTSLFISSKANENAALSELKDGMKKMYQGEVLIMGDASYKPYHMVYICDTQSGLNGFFECREVVHRLSLDTGFTTSLKPDLAVSAADPYQTNWWMSLFGVAMGIRAYRYSLWARAKFVKSFVQGGYLGKSGPSVLAKMIKTAKKGVNPAVGAARRKLLLDVYKMSLEELPGVPTPRQVYAKMVSKLGQIGKLNSSSQALDTEAGRTLAANLVKDLERKLGGGFTGKVTNMIVAGGGALRGTQVAAKVGALRAWLTEAGVLPKIGRMKLAGNLVVQVGLMLLTETIVEAINRGVRARKSCVIMPLRIRNLELSAGIGGHRGGVLGDAKSATTKLIEAFTSIQGAFNNAETNEFGDSVKVLSFISSGLLLLLGSTYEPPAEGGFGFQEDDDSILQQLSLNNYLDIGEVLDTKTAKLSSYGSVPVGGEPIDGSGGNSLPQLARSFIGRPYVWGAGREANPTAFDCSGFAYFILKRFGKNISPGTAAEQFKQGVPIDVSQLQIGDLLFFSNTGNRTGITHVGVYIGKGKMVHAATQKRGVAEDFVSDTYYTSHFAGARRYH